MEGAITNGDIINLGGERFRLIDGRWHWCINETRWAAESDETLCDALHEIRRLRTEIGRPGTGVGPDDPAGCPGGLGSQCCGHHIDCARALGLCQ